MNRPLTCVRGLFLTLSAYIFVTRISLRNFASVIKCICYER